MKALVDKYVSVSYQETNRFSQTVLKHKGIIGINMDGRVFYVYIVHISVQNLSYCNFLYTLSMKPLIKALLFLFQFLSSEYSTDQCYFSFILQIIVY